MTETKEPLSNISDSSFIILGQGSLPFSISSEAADVECSDKTNKTFIPFKPDMLTSNGSSLNKSIDGQSFLEDDIQEKLKQLIRENFQLKETLGQNNLAIKSQLDTFYMWQQEVLKTHEAHKKKFMETKDLILKLRTENLNLKKQMNESFCAFYDEDDSKAYETDACDDWVWKLEKLNLKRLCEGLRNKNEILVMENAKLKEKLIDTEKEVMKLNGIMRQKDESEGDTTQEKLFKQENDESWKKSVNGLSHGPLPNSEARVQINNLIKQLEMERDKVSKLKEKLEKGSDTFIKAENLDGSEETSEHKNSHDFNLPHNCHNQRYNTLQSWVKIDEGNSDDADHKLSHEMTQLDNYFCQGEKTCQLSKQYETVENLFPEISKDKKDLIEEPRVRNDEKSKIQNYELKYLNLLQELKIKDDELLLKQEECDELKEVNKKLKLECEKVAILKVQVEVYQNDFNDERSARERLVAEKEEMVKQIIHLQSRLEALEKGHKEDQEEQHQEEAEVSGSFFRPYKGKKCNYICPKCMFSFSDLRTCQEHVDECLNIHFYP